MERQTISPFHKKIENRNSHFDNKTETVSKQKFQTMQKKKYFGTCCLCIMHLLLRILFGVAFIDIQRYARTAKFFSYGFLAIVGIKLCSQLCSIFLFSNVNFQFKFWMSLISAELSSSSNQILLDLWIHAEKQWLLTGIKIYMMISNCLFETKNQWNGIY